MILRTTRSFAVIINPFTTLGIPDTSSLEEAKKAYKQLVMKYHPDVSKEDNTEKFREIAEAYSLVKKRIESRENLAIPKEEGFTSRRPKYDGKVGSTVRDDKVREYINFTPIDIKIHDKDRLGINYRPLFDDSDTVHPKTGTMWILSLCAGLASLLSYLLLNTKKRDEELNFLLYEKLRRKYIEGEVDPDELHPSLKVVTEDPEYLEYIKNKEKEKLESQYKTMQKVPVVFDRFDLKSFELNEPGREFNKNSYKYGEH